MEMNGFHVPCVSQGAKAEAHAVGGSVVCPISHRSGWASWIVMGALVQSNPGEGTVHYIAILETFEATFRGKVISYLGLEAVFR